MKKTDYPVSNSTKTKFEDSDEHELSSFEHEDRDEHELSSLEDEKEEEEEEGIERELVDVTFEQLQKVRSDGSHWVCKKPNQEKESGLANKNRPMKASCKKPVGRLREVVQIPKREEQKKLDKSKDPYAVNRFKHSIVWMER
ncbi:rRNA biogenesis protein RRP36-like [Quercus lobata]|uniref:rRNA biogenesis protein RRP36-like n=1 Tax=Quercus lobata TaxID=97700 RepID=UPI0012471DCA|nr:rRNA biogenesis protein RRP36-like [Quercus lobata]